MDIGAWLRGLGLERYEEAFRDNDVDAKVLPHLTAEDLRDIGIASVGHRRTLLAAIEALPPAAPSPGPEPSAATARAADPAREAERRQLTVMFVDLVGSTALSERLDPEDMREVIRSYQNAVAGEVTRFEGQVAKYMGDGVLAYFGWPRAHEDDAERAVRAGLAVMQSLAGMSTPDGQPLKARAGIATGLVVVGDLVGEGTAQEEAVIGETPNLAARLQDIAPPGMVAVAATTRRLIGSLFDVGDLGARRLKGFTSPVQAWVVLGESRAKGRFEALRGEQPVPLVGREHELAILLERWDWSKEGDGQVVLLSGEPGIGKSRLVRALRERLRDPHTAISHFCSPHHTNSALHPVIGHLERAIGYTAEDSAEQRLDKLGAFLTRSPNNGPEAVPLLASLLSIPVGLRYPPLGLSPQRQKQRIIEVLVHQLAATSTQRPMVAIYEDVHWIDPTTAELLDLVVERTKCLRVLAVITFRPEFEPPWTGQAHVTQLPLNRLGRSQGAAIVAHLTHGKIVPVAVVDQVVDKTDGVPLFVEELTKAILESDRLTESDDHFEVSGPLTTLAIPATLHDSLMSRLDRLGPVKEVAQVAAAIGREFPQALLAAIADGSGTELAQALDELVAAGLVFRRGTPPDAVYSFKHALVQDTAYQSLLKDRRRQLHGRIALALEEQFPEAAEAQPEIVAHHLTEAGLAEQAAGYWRKAGQLSVARSGTSEAIALLNRGIEVSAAMTDGPSRERKELELQIALGDALRAARGSTAPETERAFRRARELSDRLDEPEHHLKALNGQLLVHFNRAELGEARDAACELLRLARRQDEVALKIAHHAFGIACFAMGQLGTARTHLEESCGIGERIERWSSFAEAPDSNTCIYLAWTLFALGYLDQAATWSDRSFAIADRVGEPLSLAFALGNGCYLPQLMRDGGKVRERAEALIPLASDKGLPVWLNVGSFFRGWSWVEGGEVDRGIQLMRESLDGYRALGMLIEAPYFLSVLAQAGAKAGRGGEALHLLAEAMEHVGQTSERWFEAELHRLRGELLLSLANADPAEPEAAFCRALEVARMQDAKLWELRAATSLSRLWFDRRERQRARDLLVPTYGWFTEGFDTPDLIEAKALLDELR